MSWRTVPTAHPALPGHFPGNPIVPAVLVLEHVLAVAGESGLHISGIRAARFLRPLAPAAPFRVALKPRSGGHGFTVETRDGALVARGHLETT